MAAYELFLRARDLFRWSGAGDPRSNGERPLHRLAAALNRALLESDHEGLQLADERPAIPGLL